uniref:Uncharacterized protein n=1 Tax=Oryza brachyantha TaxID=4533 RepID=J3N7W1_ORYBR
MESEPAQLHGSGGGNLNLRMHTEMSSLRRRASTGGRGGAACPASLAGDVGCRVEAELGTERVHLTSARQQFGVGA